MDVKKTHLGSVLNQKRWIKRENHGDRDLNRAERDGHQKHTPRHTHPRLVECNKGSDLPE